jgi:hypothetical protein
MTREERGGGDLCAYAYAAGRKAERERCAGVERLAALAILMARNGEYLNGVHGPNGEDEGMVKAAEAMENIETEAAALRIYVGSTFYDIDQHYENCPRCDGEKDAQEIIDGVKRTTEALAAADALAEACITSDPNPKLRACRLCGVWADEPHRPTCAVRAYRAKRGTP